MKLDELVNKHYNQLNKIDLHIWNYISANRKECEKLAIDQLANTCNVSRTTILRFAQKISLKGYSELKIYLKLENEESKENTENVDLVCNTYDKLISNIKEKDCTEIFESFNSARNIYIYGGGMLHSSIKNELRRIFFLSGEIVYDLSGYKEAEYALKVANSQDMFIIISVSGENEFILDFVKKLNIKNIPVLSITKLKENSLAKISDYNLYISSITVPHILDEIEYESLTSYFILIEILFLKYMEYKRGI